MTKYEFPKSIAIALTFAMAALPKKQIGYLLLEKLEASGLKNSRATDEDPDNDTKSREVKFSFVGIGGGRGYDRHLTILVELDELDVGKWGVVRVVRNGDVSGQRITSARKAIRLQQGVNHPLILSPYDEEE